MGQITSHISGYFDGEKPSNDKTPDLYKVNLTNNHAVKKTIKTQDSENESSNFSLTSFGIFATPRNPLKRFRQISPTASLPQSIIDIFSPTKKIRIEEDYLDFSFLEDKETVTYYRKSKIMIILRGLPGSGKSTIAKHIQKKFSSSSICSADHFFMIDGVYKYDKSLIKDAHIECKKNAINAVRDQTSVVIIDNTNLKLWEAEFYLELAKEYNYIPVIVESKTPWRRDIKTLVSKTVHDMSEDTIIFKNQNFDELLPLYYGWFINDADSYFILEDGYCLIKEAFEFEEFRKDMQHLTGTSSLEELKQYFKPSGKGSLLHCTGKYIGKNLSPENIKYIDSVKHMVGQTFNIEIMGYVLTPRTFGARVKLSNKQLSVWGKDDAEEFPTKFLDVESYEESQKNELVENEEEESKGSENSINNEEQEEMSKKNGNKDPPSFNGFYDKNHESVSDLDYANTNPSNAGPVNKDGSDFGGAFETYLNNLPVENQIQKEKSWSLENGTSEMSVPEDSFKLKSHSTISNGVNTEDVVTVDSSNLSPNRVRKNKNLSPNSKKEQKRSPRKQKGNVLIPENSISIDESFTVATAEIMDSNFSEEEKFIPTIGKGSRAHLTLGCAPNVKPVTTGLDLIFTIHKETSYNNSQNFIDKENSGQKENSVLNGPKPSSVSSFSTDGVIIRNYGNGVWVFYPQEKIVTKSIFTCGF